MLDTKSRNNNQSIRLKNTAILRIASLGLAVAVLLFVSIFLHFTNVSGTSSSNVDEVQGDVTGQEILPSPVSDEPASKMPEGASFDLDTLTFSWTPRYNQAGIRTIRFEVADGLASDFEDTTIGVIQYSKNLDVNVDSNANVLDMKFIDQHWTG